MRVLRSEDRVPTAEASRFASKSATMRPAILLVMLVWVPTAFGQFRQFGPFVNNPPVDDQPIERLAADDPLMNRLDRDFKTYLATEPNRAQVERAAQLLAAMNSQSTWVEQQSVCKQLREFRSKASIPLLLAYVVRHAGLNNGRTGIAEYANSIEFLAGVEFSVPQPSGFPDTAKYYTAVREAVERFVDDWWTKHQETMTTDIDRWSTQQLGVIAQNVLEGAQAEFQGKYSFREESIQEPNSKAVFSMVRGVVLRGGFRYAPPWLMEELRPEMIEIFLASSGYKVNPTRPTRDVSRPAYAVVSLLAILRSNGEFDSLDEVAADKNQTVGARLTCAMTLYRAGEKLPAHLLVEIAEQDKNLERRLVAIHLLGLAMNDPNAARVLLDCIDDANVEIQAAAISSVGVRRIKSAIPKLRKIIEDNESTQAVTAALESLGEFTNQEACEVLVAFLENALNHTGNSPNLHHGLSALEKATSQSWQVAGAFKDEDYRAAARKAVEWWKKQPRK